MTDAHRETSSAIDGLMDATFAAAAQDDWHGVIDHCTQVIELDDEHDTAQRFLALARKRLAETGQPEPTSRDERRQLTVMFADIVDSTAMTQVLEPEQMGSMLKLYQAECSAAVAEWDGFISKWTGDGLMAYFGFPIPHEDAAYRAARAALAILERTKAMNPRLEEEFGVRIQTRIGVHTGLVVIADMGAGDWVHTSDLVGETPSIAARLEHLAPAGGAVISDSTLELVRGFVEVEPLGSYELKGIRRPVGVFQVLAPTDVVSRYEAWGAGSGPLVGRSSQLDQVVSAVTDFDPDEGVLLALVGEAGIGKTRLIDEFRSRLDTHRVIVCPCSQMSSAEPLATFHRTLLAAAGLKLGTRSDDSFERLRSALAPYVDDVVLTARLAIELGFEVPEDIELPRQTPEQSLRDIAGLYDTWLTRFGSTHPAVLVVDDAHWIDPTSRDLVLRLRSTAPHVPVVVATRSDAGSSPLIAAATKVLVLEPLTTGEIVELLSSVVTPEHRAAIEIAAERSDGVPLFAEELARVLTGHRDSSPTEIPNTLQDLLATRLDAVSQAKTTAQIAATIGRDLDVALLEHLVGADTLDTRSADSDRCRNPRPDAAGRSPPISPRAAG